MIREIRIFKRYSPLVIIMALICLTQIVYAAQFPLYMELSTWKYTDGTRSFKAKLTSENNEDIIPVSNLTVSFFMLTDDEDVLLKETKSNKDGNAIAHLPANYDFNRDAEGYINIYAIFEGNAEYESAEADLSFLDVILNIKFIEKDEEKQIFFSGKIIMQEDTIPLADNDIYFYVPRMFSDMIIADGWFESDGTGYSDFPTNIIGDSTGKVTVYGRITDHCDYGNVEIEAVSDWATPRHIIPAEGPARELWTPIAPLWMIITLIIMLAGVWGHYIYAIYELIMIKKLGKKAQKSQSKPNESISPDNS